MVASTAVSVDEAELALWCYMHPEEAAAKIRGYEKEVATLRRAIPTKNEVIESIYQQVESKRKLAKEQLKIRPTCGCYLCDAGHRPDGPAGHSIDARWIACPLQPRRVPTSTEMARTANDRAIEAASQ
jgi:hypothetical protein